MAATLGPVLVALASAVFAFGETTLVGGGLTALPTVTLGPNLLANGGFETLSGGAPASWTAGSGLGMDQLVQHSGIFSYRAAGRFATASQTLQLRPGTYRLSGGSGPRGSAAAPAAACGCNSTSGLPCMTGRRQT